MNSNKKNPEIVFFGNTKYSVIDARILNERFGLKLIVTKPDKPSGRKRELTPNPAKLFSQENRIPFIAVDKLEKDVVDKIKKHNPDFLVVADYGVILPKEVLDIPNYAPLNIHHSLLPKYRGPSPAPSTILAGEAKSGVTIIRMTEEVDAGNILAQEEYKLLPDETTDSLLTKLNELGAKLVCNIIEKYLHQGRTLVGKPQNKKLATFTRRFERTDGYIDPENPPSPKTVDRMIRAFYPWPGVHTKLMVNGKSQIIKFLPDGKIQPEGKRVMSITEFQNGYPKAYEQISHLLNNKAQS